MDTPIMEDLKNFLADARIESWRECLCRGCAMASDMPDKIETAIIDAETSDEVITAAGNRIFQELRLFCQKYKKLERRYNDILNDAYELTGEEITDIGYDNWRAA